MERWDYKGLKTGRSRMWMWDVCEVWIGFEIKKKYVAVYWKAKLNVIKKKSYQDIFLSHRK